MTFGVYSIRDVKTGFMTPTVEISDEAAARNFAHAVSHSEGILNSFVQDFSLYKIGGFDDSDGVLLPLNPPILVVDGPNAMRMLMSEARR